MGSVWSTVKSIFGGGNSSKNRLCDIILAIVNLLVKILLNQLLGYSFNIADGISDFFKSIFK